MKPGRDIKDLIAIMARLRAPEIGCPWDLKQDFRSIAPYTIEEAYEVADAIERGDFEDLKDELGDLLLQVVFHAQMASEEDRFAFGDVVEAITTKLIRRHPHVFGDLDLSDAAAVKERWDEIKAEEKAERAERRAADALPDLQGSDFELVGGRVSYLEQAPGAELIFKIREASDLGFHFSGARGGVGAPCRRECPIVSSAELDAGRAALLRDWRRSRGRPADPADLAGEREVIEPRCELRSTSFE